MGFAERPAYQEGHDAYWRDDETGEETQNPYKEGTEDHFYWDAGYDDARMEH